MITCLAKYTEYAFKDEARPGCHRPKLYLYTPQGVAHKFTGESIPRVCLVLTKEETQDGKQSSAVYRVLLAPGVRPIYMLTSRHMPWGSVFMSWTEIAQALGVPETVAREIVQKEYPKTAKRFNEEESGDCSAPVASPRQSKGKKAKRSRRPKTRPPVVEMAPTCGSLMAFFASSSVESR